MPENRQQTQKFQKIHFVGVGGIGVSRLAKYFLNQKRAVSGSDLVQNENVSELMDLGMVFFLGHDAKNVSADCELLIYSAAVPADSPERLQAEKLKIPQMSHSEVLGQISKSFKTVAVSGTNGKSTTTAMLGLILEAAKLDPTVFVGSKVKKWSGNLRIGKSRYLIVEADEYLRQFLALSPAGAIITNIEADHLDYYKDLADIRSAFEEFAKKLPETGFLCYNADDEGAKEVGEFIRVRHILPFGKSSDDLRLLKTTVKNKRQYVEISIKGKKETYELQVPGLFNVYNSLAAISAAISLNVPFGACREALGDFTGIWRRFEILGSTGDTTVISDYAHHPTAVLSTILAAKEFYPDARILIAFQPHQHERTKILFKDFVSSLVSSKPDGLLIIETFDVAGRETRQNKHTGKELALEVSKRFSETSYAADLKSAELQLKQIMKNFDVVLVMGAGDVYKIAQNLCTASKQHTPNETPDVH